MSSAPATPLRQRMIEDMSIRQFASRPSTAMWAWSPASPRFWAAHLIRPSPRTRDDTNCIWRRRGLRRAR
jgi:hypothetical protein